MWTAIGLGLRAFGTWLFKNPAIFMTGIICVMFVMVVTSKNGELAAMQRASDAKDGRITKLDTALGQARANVATLNATLGTQSASIASLERQGLDAGTKFDQLITGMAQANATTVKKIDALNKAKPGPDKCVSAQALIKGTVQ